MASPNIVDDSPQSATGKSRDIQDDRPEREKVWTVSTPFSMWSPRTPWGLDRICEVCYNVTIMNERRQTTSFSMYKTDLEKLDALTRDYGLDSRSETLRYLIRNAYEGHIIRLVRNPMEVGNAEDDERTS